MNYFEKVGAHHVDCDGDDGGDVSDGGDVEDSHDLPCKLSIHWNRRMHLPLTTFVLLLFQFSGFSICVFEFFIFLSYIFWIHWHPPRIKKCAIMRVFY